MAPNLARGTADFRRTQRAAGAEPPAPAEEESTQEYDEPADGSTSGDYDSGSGSLYELDSENSSLEPARV